ncbi:MAG: type II toxin-antitoxin system RelE/ParE family toxin [Syntrophobacteraceae bacterium]|nr:type II toxin-antitoxin system RelE/ParE family toxin [Syntrophobacteraceae bacterium]
MYELLIQRKAQKQLANITQPYRDRVIAVIRSLSDDPRPSGARKLSGRDAWRIRIGDYRVIYEINDDAPLVLVVSVGHRREIYLR